MWAVFIWTCDLPSYIGGKGKCIYLFSIMMSQNKRKKSFHSCLGKIFSSFLNLSVWIFGFIATNRQCRTGSACAECKETRALGSGDVWAGRSWCWQMSNDGHWLGRHSTIFWRLLAVINFYFLTLTKTEECRFDTLELCSLPTLWEHQQLYSAIMWSLLNLFKNSARAKLGGETLNDSDMTVLGSL